MINSKQFTNYVTTLLSTILLFGCTAIVCGVVYNMFLAPYTYRTVQTMPDLPSFKSTDVFNSMGAQNPPVVRIHKDYPGLPDKFTCSGTIISDKYLLTAAHCLVTDHQRLETATFTIHHLDKTNKFSVPAKAAAINITSDLGLMIGDFTSFKKLMIALEPGRVFAPGEFGACGFPYGDKLFCSNFIPKGPYYEFIQGHGFIYPGMSGGPVLSAATECVVGVNSSVMDGGINMAPLIGLFSSTGIEVE